MEFLQVSSLTTGVDEFVGNGNDNTFNAPAVNETTGAATTTIGAGDTLDGGAGTDTLNISVTSADNNSLAGLSVKNVEVVNITNSDFLGSGQGAAAAATTAKAAAQATLAASQAALSEAKEELAAANAIAVLTDDDSLTEAAAAKILSTSAANLQAEYTATVQLTTIEADDDVVALDVVENRSTAASVEALAAAVAALEAEIVAVEAEVGDADAADIATIEARLAEITADDFDEVVADDAGYVLADLVQAAEYVLDTVGVAPDEADYEDTVAAVEVSVGKVVTALGEIEDRLVDNSYAQLRAAYVAASTNSDGVPAADAAAVESNNTANQSAILDALATINAGASTQASLSRAANAANEITDLDTEQGFVFASTATAASTAAALAAQTALDVADPVTVAEIEAILADDFELDIADNAGYVLADYVAAAARVLAEAGASAAVDGDIAAVNDAVLADLTDIAADLAAVAADNFTTSDYNKAAANALKNASGVTLLTADDADDAAVNGVDAAAINARADVLSGFAADASSANRTILLNTNNLVIGVDADGADIELDDDGVYSLEALKAAITAAQSDDLGNTLLTEVDDSAAIELRADELDNEAYATVVAQTAVVAEARAAAVTAAAALDGITVSAASVSASSFAGAEQVWFKGTSGETAISAGATQIIGFSGVTAMDNAVTTAAVSPTFAISGSKGDLEVKGAAATSMNFIGTGGTVAPSLTTTKTNELLSVTSSTSGTLTLDLTSLTDLETATADGAGALSLQNSPTTLASITTGAGADKMQVSTATAEDNEDTDEVETVSAVVSTGAGKDTIIVSTTGAGTTSIDAGEGDDSVTLNTKSTDTVSIDLGDGSDTFELGALSNISTKTTVSGGDGVDTLITSENNFKASDYLLLKSYVSGFEKLVIDGADAEIDASELDGFASIDFKNGDGTVTEVNGQTLILSSREEADEVEEIGLAAVAESTGDDLVAVALGYDNDDLDAIEFGGDLNVVVTGNSAAAVLGGENNTLTLSGNNATVTAAVAPLGDSVSLPAAVIAGDIVTLTANLSSLALASKGTAINVASILNVSVIDGANLANLETITVRGAGNVTINGGAAVEEDAVLTKIDVSGMTKQIKVDGEGDETGENQSVTSITGNANAAEEILLGGAQDTIVQSGSTAGALDSVTGFTLVATKSDSEVANTALSDKITTDGGEYIFDEDASYSSLTEAVLELASDLVNDGHIFHADGNTYIFNNGGDGEYDDGDLLLELTGTYDLTLLANLINPVA